MHFYPFAQRLGIFAQRIQAGRVLPKPVRSPTSPRRALGTHTFGDLRLRESGGSPRGEHFVEQGKLLAFEPLVFSTYHRILSIGLPIVHVSTCLISSYGFQQSVARAAEFLGLFDKAVQHDNALPTLSAVKHAGDAFRTFSRSSNKHSTIAFVCGSPRFAPCICIRAVSPI